MIDASPTSLLFLEPQLAPSAVPVIDELTRKMAGAWRNRETSRDGYRGDHSCTSPGCCARSDNRDHWVYGAWPDGTVLLKTHSLAVHYLAYHRAEVPQVELEKVVCLAADPIDPLAHELASPGQPVAAREPDQRRLRGRAELPPETRAPAPASAPPSDLEKLLAEIGAANSTVTALHARAVDLDVADEAIGRLFGAALGIADARDIVRDDIAARSAPPVVAPATGTVREFASADPDCPTDVIGQVQPGWYYWTGERWDGQANTKAMAEYYASIGAITR